MPNSFINTQVIVNTNLNDQMVVKAIQIGIGYDSDKERFDKENIEIPYNYQNIIIKKEK